MRVEFLITCIHKTQCEIQQLLDNSNIYGDIIVGNQLCKEEKNYIIKTNNYTAKVFDMTSRGVSKNRNFLLQNSTADYVTFFDDDIKIINNQEIINKYILKDFNCFRFQSQSENKDRPIKFLNVKKNVVFRSVSSFGVWGCFFKRSFLIKNKILFREDVGPGTEINHGEDSIFLYEFCKKAKIYNIPELLLSIKQSESTWLNESRDLKIELYSHGFVYYCLYKNLAHILSLLFLITHMHCYPKGTKFSTLYVFMKKGIKSAKERKKYESFNFGPSR